MKRRYEWRELTDDGLLRKPPKFGYAYEGRDVNTWGGFDSEEEAVAHWKNESKGVKYGVPRDLVLLTIFRLEQE